MEKEIPISELIEMKTPPIRELWYDWWCKETSLENKGKSLFSKLKSISKSKKFDTTRSYVFFKNNCPMVGSLYDDFRICDIETGRVIFTVVPKSGHKSDNGKGCVYSPENGLEYTGSWKEIKNWFLS